MPVECSQKAKSEEENILFKNYAVPEND